MAVAKRAKWVEGITQSKRILRDLAEIVTSAIRDENGPIEAENWKMVYPRPFLEYPLDRGRLIKDQTDSRLYVPVMDKEVMIRMIGLSTEPIEDGANVVLSTIVVKNDTKSVTYVEGTDYTVDPATFTIDRIETGSITDGSELFVSYGMKLHKIIEAVPVKVEKVLPIANPDREIDPLDYTVDYVNKQIVFNSAPPTDAAYFALTFTEVNGPYSRTEREMLQLEADLLDPLGQTFKLPSGTGDIGATGTDVRVAASTATGPLAVGSGGAIQYQLDEMNHTVTWTAGEPTLNAETQAAYINVYESTDPPVNSVFVLRRYQIVKNADAGAPAGEWVIVGAVNELNDGKPHSVEIETETTTVTLFKHLSATHAGFEELDTDLYTTNFNTPGISTYIDIAEDLRVTLTGRGEDNMQIGLGKISDRVVLSTKTEPEQVFGSVLGQEYGAVDTAESLEMFVEFVKPKQLVNPETGLTRYVDVLGIQQETQSNNHYIQTRMFDRWDDHLQRPQGVTYDTDGRTILDRGAYVSDWSKYSWFKDWKEYMVDELDSDPGSANASDGIIFKEVTTQGMTEEFPIQFWISTNNNRIGMILMGDPTLDQDNFLTSFGYFGRVHPFFDKECVVKKNEDGTISLDAQGNPIIEEKRTYFQNDVSGNFALSVGSSTLPASIGAPPIGQPIMDIVEVATNDDGTLVAGSLYDDTAFAYLVTYLTEVGESKPSLIDGGRLAVPNGTVAAGSGGTVRLTPEQGISLKLRFRLPEEATGYRIYRYHDADTNIFAPDSLQHTKFKLVTSVTKLDRARTIEYVDNGDILPMYQESTDALGVVTHVMQKTSWLPFYTKFLSCAPTARAFESVVRDRFTGAILDVKFSDKFGKDTGTGVNDIMMFQTRSGLKYQRHQAAFITTEEFMRKEKSGQSRWTGKFHLSPIYIEHSYDKQRGWLDGIMAVDDSGIEHLDELIVDKDTPNEEVYKFFRVNAPYSMFNNSPNYAYGLAIIKSSLRWE